MRGSINKHQCHKTMQLVVEHTALGIGAASLKAAAAAAGYVVSAFKQIITGLRHQAGRARPTKLNPS